MVSDGEALIVAPSPKNVSVTLNFELITLKNYKLHFFVSRLHLEKNGSSISSAM